MDEFSFKTIAKRTEEVLMREKGSKFIGYAFPLNDEEEFRGYLNDIKALHPKATHHCYAFRIGKNGENYRANDDGEPSGSAGLPIFNQILAAGLTNVLVIVVRYYGGTKLGVAGLIKAYKETAQQALAQAETLLKEEEIQLKMSTTFEKQGIIFSFITRFSGIILDTEIKENFTVIAAFKKAQKEGISKTIIEMPDLWVEFL